MYVLCCFILVLFNFKELNANLNKYKAPPEAETPLGTVQGHWRISYEGRHYAAFEGIPYAKPPVAELRFKEPQPIEKWSGTWNATKLYRCIQNAIDIGSDSAGEEDCLYLNVFVPKKVDDPSGLDVVIHIHGGGFMFGSGHDFLNPDYVMDRDIVFVTINYRLGPLGFLSTQDEVLPGNNGMKDQVQALKWVQQNIASFGGNPNSVTITGFSAGGVSVHLHYLSPLSKGLFHRGMSLSGVATDDWGIEENPLQYTNKLASLVGCPTSTSSELVECLKTRPASLLIEKTKYLYGYPPTPVCLLRPVVEKQSENSFLVEHPYKSLVEKRVLDVPWITSVTRDDGLIVSIFFLENLEKLNNEWSKAAPEILEYREARHKSDIAYKIRDYYLGQGNEFNENNKNEFTKMCTDKFFVINAESAAKLHSKASKSPVYFYYFNYDEGENTFVDLFSYKKVPGVSHGDDLIYFFGGPILKPLSESDIKLKNACLDMLYTYAKTGVPKFEGVQWTPTGGDKLTYLNITGPEDIKLHETSDLTSTSKFWKDLGLLENDNLLKGKDEL